MLSVLKLMSCKPGPALGPQGGWLRGPQGLRGSKCSKLDFGYVTSDREKFDFYGFL